MTLTWDFLKRHKVAVCLWAAAVIVWLLPGGPV